MKLRVLFIRSFKYDNGVLYDPLTILCIPFGKGTGSTCFHNTVICKIQTGFEGGFKPRQDGPFYINFTITSAIIDRARSLTCARPSTFVG